MTTAYRYCCMARQLSLDSHNYEVLREVPAPRVFDPPDEGLKEVHETLQGGEWMAVNKAIM